MTKTTTYSGEIRCEHNGEQIGWVYRAGDGRWVAKLNGENRIIGRHGRELGDCSHRGVQRHA